MIDMDLLILVVGVVVVRRNEKRPFDYLPFVLGTGVGLFTNLATAQADRWPGWAQPLVSYSWAIGGLLVAAVAIAWWRDRRGRIIAVPPWALHGENPYPGLTAYSVERAGVFAGRREEVRGLCERVLGASVAHLRFVPVVGPSGVGKSSLVLAGLLSRLGRGWKVLPDITPGIDALSRLGAVVCGTDLSLVASLVAANPDVTTDDPQVGQLIRQLTLVRGRADRLLIVIDQMEELVTLQTAGERNRFLGLLARMVQLDLRLSVVATIRSEYIGVFQQGPASGLFTVPFMVNAMTRAQLRQVIVDPAVATDTTFDGGLVEEILADAGDGDALPLLSYFLSDLYDKRGLDPIPLT